MNCIAVSASPSSSMLSRTSPCGEASSKRRANGGSDATHGAHQVAQKSRSTGRPLSDLSESFLPSGESKVTSGAPFPRRLVGASVGLLNSVTSFALDGAANKQDFARTYEPPSS